MSSKPTDTSPFGVAAFQDNGDLTVYTFPLPPGDNASYFRGVTNSAEAKDSLRYIRAVYRAVYRTVYSTNQWSTRITQFTSNPQTIATVTKKLLGLSDTPDAAQVTQSEGQKLIGHTYRIPNQGWGSQVFTYASIISQLGGLNHDDDTLGLRVGFWAEDRASFETLTAGIESAMSSSPSWTQRLGLSFR